MKKCSCGSYAVNIERFTGDNCDVCHYKKQSEKLSEELETLRASNTIKQANIELLEAENERLQNNIDGNEAHIKSLEEAFDKIEKYNWQLLAEREAMMKQEPAAYGIYAEDGNIRIWWRNLKNNETSEFFMAKRWCESNGVKFDDVTRLYISPLPAQQIPEGYTAIKTEVFEWLLGENGDFKCPESQYLRGKPAPYFWRSKLRNSVLSASQPKGDV